MSEDIRVARAMIKKIMVEEMLYAKGGENFTSLNGNDIAALFKLYDITFFHRQIQEKINEMGSSIEFYARSRKTGVAGLCGVKMVNGVRIYFLDIAPNIIESIFKFYRKGLPTAAGVGCNDRLGCVQLIIEHEIIHLLSIIWGFTTPPPLPPPPPFGDGGGGGVEDDSDAVYGIHGELFQCMIQKYFGHSLYDHDIGLTGVVGIFTPEEIKFESGPTPGRSVVPAGFLKYRASRGSLIGAGFENWSASCYLDSVLMVLFDSISPFWRKNIMDVNVSAINYTGRISGADVTSINTVDKMRTQARKIQAQIKDDYSSTHGLGVSGEKKIIKCTMLRQLLAEVVPSMRPYGRWVLFNTGAVYDAIVEVFPDLTLDIPYQIHRWVPGDFGTEDSGYSSDSVDYASEASLTMWDYLDPLTDLEEHHDYKEIRWDLIDTPVLVFYNGGTPRIRNFGRSGRERGYVYIQGDRTGTIKKHEFDIIKGRSFGPTIIDDRYRLIGVITLEGVSPTNEGGSHYTAHFLGTDENWYYYNDLGVSGARGATVIKVDHLPDEGVWMESGSSMPSMYFYQKVKGPYIEKPPLRRTIRRGPTPGGRISRSPEPEIYIYKGTMLDYKKIRSGSDPYDISYMYFVYDKTKNFDLSAILDKMIPFTHIEKGVRMWKVDDKNRTGFEAEIKTIDIERAKMRSNTAPGLEARGSGINSVAIGEVYEMISGSTPGSGPRGIVQIVNYTENTFAVISPTPIPQLKDGLMIRNLKYGFTGYGYIYVKSRLLEIEQRLSL
jgi:hypothetical protein